MRGVGTMASAEDFYTQKLQKNPEMPRYNHFMAAIASHKGQEEDANAYYRATIAVQPHNIAARNDYAVHLASSNRKLDALHELDKGRLITEDSALLQKNLAAVLGNSGQYNAALAAATRARFLDPTDAMNHRNIAKLHVAMGDSRSALVHNLQSVQLENPRAVAKPHTSAFRAAAVQLIAKGGSRSEAFQLMDAARFVEKKHYDLPTSQLTKELVLRIKSRYGTNMHDLERQEADIAAKKKVYDYDDKNNILSEIRRMRLSKSIKN
jgi:tetratricopeptide (TPR) repeat protein